MFTFMIERKLTSRKDLGITGDGKIVSSLIGLTPLLGPGTLPTIYAKRPDPAREGRERGVASIDRVESRSGLCGFD